ncbi:MAG: right-handed parallel beta-helix repeat-containing protein, partial [Candidatus Hydrogenedentes bacterium]|nr:right-handed parallel beta-helix repeat-containing protein [Candidatus Hydrogenedentota bacterium]
PGVFRDITIENNRIHRSDNAAIFISATDTATITGNDIQGVCDKPTQESCTAAIHIQSSKNVTLKNNHLDLAQQGAACKTILHLAEDNELSTIEKD